jgi:hypothetical protein
VSPDVVASMQFPYIVSEEAKPGSVPDESQTLGCPDQHATDAARCGHYFEQLNVKVSVQQGRIRLRVELASCIE